MARKKTKKRAIVKKIVKRKSSKRSIKRKCQHGLILTPWG